MNKFSNKLKKNYFGPFSTHYSNFGDEKIFPENPALLHTTSHGVLAPCQTLEKINNALPRKRSDRRLFFLIQNVIELTNDYLIKIAKFL